MTNEQEVIKNKLGLLKLAQRLGNVSQACKEIGFSRDSFYRFFVSGGGARSIWPYHDLQTFDRRLKAISAKVAQDALMLTEDQL